MAGVRSIILDENQTLGGQIFRRIPSGFTVADETKLGGYYVKGGKILSEVAALSNRIEVWTDSLVWGVFEDKQLAIIRNGTLELLRADQLIIAPGAYDRPVPFPGWTLPGVFTAGCAQVMIKSQRMLPGSRFLLAGCGPLQLTLADQLLKNGAKVARGGRGVFHGKRVALCPRFVERALTFMGRFQVPRYTQVARRPISPIPHHNQSDRVRRSSRSSHSRSQQRLATNPWN